MTIEEEIEAMNLSERQGPSDAKSEIDIFEVLSRNCWLDADGAF